MIGDEGGQRLHDRATRGERLSVEERVVLDTWYRQQDADEMVEMDIREGTKSFRLGSASEIVKLSVFCRSHPHANDYWDGNWIKVRLTVITAGFSGIVTGDLRTDELASFHAQLSRLHEDLSGQADLVTLEDWLTIQVHGDRQGHIICHCEIRDQPGSRNMLVCTLRFDQSYLPTTLKELASVVAAFPVIGKEERE